MDGRISNYEYLVVIDLETVPKFAHQSAGVEPVELAWVVLPNTLNFSGSDGIYHKEQIFIVPETASLPSEDYPGLENGVSASTAFRKLHNYLKNALISKNRTFCFVVERVSTFQLLRSLVLEHLESNSASHWLRTLVLLTEFARSYVSPEPVSGVTDMLRLLRIQYPVPFTALESCLAQYTVITRMMRDGFAFSSPELVAGAAQGRISPWESTTSELWISGLSSQTQPHHIVNFLRIPVTSAHRVIICISRSGRPTGHAIVNLASHHDVLHAVNSWHMSVLGDYPVALSVALPGEFAVVAARQAVIREHFSQAQQASTAAWPVANNLAAANNLSDSQLAPRPQAPTTTTTTTADDGIPPTGVLPSQLLPASGNWSDALTSSATLPESAVSEAAMDVTPASETEPTPPSGGPVLLNRNVLMDMCSRFAEGTVVLARGLAHSTTLEVLASFLSSFATEPSSLVMTTLEDGRPSGDAFVAFKSAEQAEAAIRELSGKTVEDRQVELSLVN